MGFRAVADLDDYTTSELVQLLQNIAALIRQRLGGDDTRPRAESASSFSVVGSDELAAGAAAAGTPPEPPVSRRSSTLLSPFDCPYHCKYCFEQCCRPEGSHKNHACLAHRHRR